MLADNIGEFGCGLVSAGCRLYTENEMLLDNIGDFEAAVKDTAKSVGITGEPTLVRPERERRMTMLDWILGDAAKYLPRLRRSPIAGAFLDGVNAAAVALMATVGWQFARAALVNVPAVVLGGIGTLIVVGLWMRFFPALRRVDRLESVVPSN